MGSALDLALPAFAPVPYEILVQMLMNRRRDTLLKTAKRAPTTIKIHPTNLLEEESGFSQQEWDTLLHDLKPLRQAVFEEMDPVVRAGRLTTAWISEKLLEATPGHEQVGGPSQTTDLKKRRKQRPGVSRSTLAGWEERGLMEFGGRNSPDPDVAAALLIARQIEKKRLRNWLPSEIARTVDRALDAREPVEMGEVQDQLSEAAPGTGGGTWLLCWRQDPPSSSGTPPLAPMSSPIPLPPGLANATVLVSPWQGFLWRSNWRRRINSLGVGRWYGIDENGWGVTVEDLKGWIGETEQLVIPHMEIEAPDVFQELADIVLNRVCYDLLTRLPGPSPTLS